MGAEAGVPDLKRWREVCCRGNLRERERKRGRARVCHHTHRSFRHTHTPCAQKKKAMSARHGLARMWAALAPASVARAQQGGAAASRAQSSWSKVRDGAPVERAHGRQPDSPRPAQRRRRQRGLLALARPDWCSCAHTPTAAGGGGRQLKHHCRAASTVGGQNERRAAFGFLRPVRASVETRTLSRACCPPSDTHAMPCP